MSKNNEERQAQASGETPVFCAIEEHAKALDISAPVFAAVRQSQGWASGKKVEKTEFEKAVKSFLNAPVGGANNGFARR